MSQHENPYIYQACSMEDAEARSATLSKRDSNTGVVL